MSANTHPKFNTWQILEMVRGFVWKNVAGLQGLPLIQILLKFLTVELLPNFIISNATDLKHGSSTYFVSILSISGIQKLLGIKFKGG